MGFIDDVNAVREEILINISQKITDRSIKKVAVAQILNDIISLVAEVYSGSSNFINYSYSNLLNAGTDDAPNWYLPFLDQNGDAMPVNSKPILVENNGNSFTPIFSTIDPITNIPFEIPRLYGFGDNETPQNIIVTFTVPSEYIPIA